MNESLWQRAASFAARAHLHGVRKDERTPYIAHPFRVAMTVRHVFGCEDEIAMAVALLHDTIEDTTTDYDDLEEQFGSDVADCVAALTKTKSLREDERERAYDAALAQADWRARLVKLADVYDNAMDLCPQTPENQRKSRRRCERALALAAADASRPEVARAIECVRALTQ